MGHTHCNEVTANDTRNGDALGFMVAGQGMEGCQNFGLPILTTTAATTSTADATTTATTTQPAMLEIMYYNIQNLKDGTDQYDNLVKCFDKNGPHGCKELGTTWLNQTIGDTVW
jgi:hypothetical protein